MVSRRPHEVHGRIQIIEITDAGRELLVRCNSAVQSAETALLFGVTQADEIAVRRWLVQVAKHLDPARE